jgi:hypothetical protein
LRTGFAGQEKGVDKSISPLYRAIGLLGAVAAGIALWRFTSGDWLGGALGVLVVAGAAAVYVEGQRRLKGSGGRRRY